MNSTTAPFLNLFFPPDFSESSSQFGALNTAGDILALGGIILIACRISAIARLVK
jgi:hypothetical protein